MVLLTNMAVSHSREDRCIRATPRTGATCQKVGVLDAADFRLVPEVANPLLS
jgi:hypothetical protein